MKIAQLGVVFCSRMERDACWSVLIKTVTNIFNEHPTIFLSADTQAVLCFYNKTAFSITRYKAIFMPPAILENSK